jgi:hypothetical protein
MSIGYGGDGTGAEANMAGFSFKADLSGIVSVSDGMITLMDNPLLQYAFAPHPPATIEP